MTAIVTIDADADGDLDWAVEGVVREKGDGCRASG
jgi:hypothetical protein